MRKWLLLVVAAVLMAPAAGFAKVQGSMHDMDAYTGTEGNVGGACAYCHIPHGAQGEKLYKTTIGGTTRWKIADQPVSRICSTCHNLDSGGIIATTHSGRESEAMFNDNAHLDNLAILGAWGDNNDLASDANLKLSVSRLRLECSSCHDVHNHEYRPFMRGLTTKGNINQNCVRCHGGRENPGSGGVNNSVEFTSSDGNGFASQHPTDRALTETALAGDDDVFAGPIGAFATVLTDAVNTAASETWVSRGKLNINSKVGCNTCHAVHGVQADGTATTTFYNASQRGPGVVILAMDQTQSTNSPFCEGCHTAGTNGQSVVVSDNKKHPVNTVSSGWTIASDFRDATTYAKNWTFPVVSPNLYIVCESCHDVHYGSNNTAILRKKSGNQDGQAGGGIDNEVATSFTSVGEFCNECHSKSTAKSISFGTGKGKHHPISYKKNGTDVLKLVFEGDTDANIWIDSGGLRHASAAETAWGRYGDPATSVTPVSPSRIPTTGAFYKFGNIGSDNVMTCGTCHGNVASGVPAGAHPLSFPLDTNEESEMCVDCHTFNPSAYVLKYEKGSTPTLDNTSTMTHFVGQAKSATQRTSATVGGFLPPTAFVTKGAKTSADGRSDVIICESCHFWKSGNDNAVNTGADGHDAAKIQNSVDGMIAPSGNTRNPATWNLNLCSGCHGESPGGVAGSKSHQTMPKVSTPALGTVVTNVGNQANKELGIATLHATSSGAVNCESCHRPHNATAGTGALILEAGTTDPASNKTVFQLAADNTGSTSLNQEGLCLRCHTQGR